MDMTWYICEKNDSCVDCPIIYREEKSCPHMIEVREVIHAKWEWFDAWEGDDTFGEWKMLRCSNCLGSEGARENAKFCSECGAIMDA